MDFKIVWTLRSREDLHDIAAFIAKDNPPAALKLGGLIFNRVDSLERFPELGRVVPERNQLNIREIVVKNYALFIASIKRKSFWKSCASGTARGASRKFRSR